MGPFSHCTMHPLQLGMPWFPPCTPTLDYLIYAVMSIKPTMFGFFNVQELIILTICEPRPRSPPKHTQTQADS